MTKILPLSVVIASIGGPTLLTTIESINCGSHIPDEIIICLPFGVDFNLIKYKNVRILHSSRRGQVLQRLYALNYCVNDYIMQSDDDILYDFDSLISLYTAILNLGINTVVGPIIKDDIYKENIYKFKGIFKLLYDSVICLAPFGVSKMGKLTKAGFGFGVSDLYLDKNIPYRVDWLPGGCVLSHKKSTIFYNYYPFNGKAYSEDLINSILRTRNNILHFVIPNSCIYLISTKCFNKIIFSETINIIKIQYFVVSLIKGNRFFYFIWASIFFLKNLVYKFILNR